MSFWNPTVNVNTIVSRFKKTVDKLHLHAANISCLYN